MKRDGLKRIEALKGVGPARADKFKELGIENLRDLLYYFPRDYEDRSILCPCDEIRPGEKALIRGEVLTKRMMNLKSDLNLLRVTFTDGSCKIDAIWFNQAYLAQNFTKGEVFFIFGEVSEEYWRRYGRKKIVNPVYEKADSENHFHTNRVIPIYSLADGISQRNFRRILLRALDEYLHLLEDWMPKSVEAGTDLFDIRKAIREYHFPSSRRAFIMARERLAFNELFLLQLKQLKNRGANQHKSGKIQSPDLNSVANFFQQLDFEMTSAQKKAWHQIAGDMESPAVMHRLLQGDVGSGKTVVAALALLTAVNNDNMGLVMTPTEILAEQHLISLQEHYADLELNLELFTGSLSPGERERIENEITRGEVDILVGTHALLEREKNCEEIGLAVIDEQHRFGVDQRKKLIEKEENMDVLVMTATPIPRSMALAFFGGLDITVIDELPGGRAPVVTVWRQREDYDDIYEFLRSRLRRGEKAYIVCPLREPSQKLPDLVSAVERKEVLEDEKLRDFAVELLHGRMKYEDKRNIMQKFRRDEIDVLVTTSVIEVGIDIEKATFMIIENADRFGLAQLHQLRGRVGRGQKKSYCVLISDTATDQGRKRLATMVNEDDGFDIARKDLEIRGPGEFFGTRQHGHSELKVADIFRDKELIERAHAEAEKYLNSGRRDGVYYKLCQKAEKLERI